MYLLVQSTLRQHPPGVKPLPEPMMTQFVDAYMHHKVSVSWQCLCVPWLRSPTWFIAELPLVTRYKRNWAQGDLYLIALLFLRAGVDEGQRTYYRPSSRLQMTPIEAILSSDGARPQTSVLSMDHSGYGLSQWGKALLCNAFSHWAEPIYSEWAFTLSSGQKSWGMVTSSQNSCASNESGDISY